MKSRIKPNYNRLITDNSKRLKSIQTPYYIRLYYYTNKQVCKKRIDKKKISDMYKLCS